MAREGEDSGRIDLDALLRQAGLVPGAEPARAPSRPPGPATSATPPAMVAPAEPAPPSATPPRAPSPPTSSPAVAISVPRLPVADRSDRPKPVMFAPVTPTPVTPTAAAPASTRAPVSGIAAAVAACIAAAAVIAIGPARPSRPDLRPSTTAVVLPSTPLAASPAVATSLGPAPAPTRAASPDDLPTVAAEASTIAPPIPRAAPPVHAAASAAAAATSPSPPPSPSSPGDLGDAMRASVGDRGGAEPSSPARESTGPARQLRPSPGALVGAVNAVLPAARACLAREDAPRPGTLVFRGNGQVERVELDAPSSEDDACIRTALLRARIEPFVDAPFRFRVLVRP